MGSTHRDGGQDHHAAAARFAAVGATPDSCRRRDCGRALSIAELAIGVVSPGHFDRAGTDDAPPIRPASTTRVEPSPAPRRSRRRPLSLPAAPFANPHASRGAESRLRGARTGRESADPGAEEGAGAHITVKEPWTGYGQMNARDVIDRARLAGVADSPRSGCTRRGTAPAGPCSSRSTPAQAGERRPRSLTGRGPHSSPAPVDERTIDMPEAKTLNQRDAKLVGWLGEAHAKEAQLEADLATHISVTQKPAYKKRLQTHLKETRDHKRRVATQIKKLGGPPARACSTSRGPSARSPARPSPLSKGRWARPRARHRTGRDPSAERPGRVREEHTEIAINTRIEVLPPRSRTARRRGWRATSAATRSAWRSIRRRAATTREGRAARRATARSANHLVGCAAGPRASLLAARASRAATPARRSRPARSGAVPRDEAQPRPPRSTRHRVDPRPAQARHRRTQLTASGQRRPRLALEPAGLLGAAAPGRARAPLLGARGARPLIRLGGSPASRSSNTSLGLRLTGPVSSTGEIRPQNPARRRLEFGVSGKSIVVVVEGETDVDPQSILALRT